VYVVADCGTFDLPDVSHSSVTISIALPMAAPLSPEVLPGLGSRYLRLTAPADEGREEVIRVRILDLNGFPAPHSDVRYVGLPLEAPEEDYARPGLTFTAAPLTCEPTFHDWSLEGVIALYGAEIVPESVYEVQRASASCPDLLNEACWSSPSIIRTGVWGDVVPPFADPLSPPQPEFTDIAAVVDKFLSMPEATIKTMAQLQPNVVAPGTPIDFLDIADVVNAFLQVPYASRYAGPCACPPAVSCGAAPCATDGDCTIVPDGLCVSGFCTDACGRCAR
jgi:hypothetical protein